MKRECLPVILYGILQVERRIILKLRTVGRIILLYHTISYLIHFQFVFRNERRVELKISKFEMLFGCQ